MRAILWFQPCSLYTDSCRVFRFSGSGTSVHGAIFRKFGAYGVAPCGGLYALPGVSPGTIPVQGSLGAATLHFSFDLLIVFALCLLFAEFMFDFSLRALITDGWFNRFRTLDVSWLLFS